MPSSANSRFRPFAAAAVVVGCAVLAYWNTLGAPFVYDDALAIPQNPTIRALWPISDVLMPQEGGLTVSGRPLLNFSFAINYAISGNEPWSYHATNFLIHAAAGLFLFGIARRAIRAAAPRDSIFGQRADAFALLLAVLWVAHPLQTQAVSYTVQRAESLMGMLYLLTLYCFVRATDEPESTRGRSGWLIASVAACALGMMTKEVMATAPLLVLLFDRTFVTGSFVAALRRRPAYYTVLATTWLLLAYLVLSTGGNRGGTAGFGTGVPWWAYALTQFQAVSRYLALSVWPCPLIFEYGTFWAARAADVLPYAVVVLPLLALTAVALRRWPAVGFCGAWFFLILAPTSLTPGKLQMIVEHRMYLPLAAVLGLIVVAVGRILGRHALLGLGLACATCLLLTVHRNTAYRSHLALWTDTVAKRPDNPRARACLGEAYEELGRPEEAIVQRTVAVRLQPDDAREHYNLALTLASAGRTEDAIRHYLLSVKLDPKEARAHNNLAICLRQANRLPEALEHYAAATRLAPAEPLYHYNYGVGLLQADKLSEAVAEFSAALQLQPGNADAHFNRGGAYVGLKRLDEALSDFATALRLRPDDTEYRSTLAQAHAEIADQRLRGGNVPDAIRHYEAALQLNPQDAIGHHNLGIAYVRQERWSAALREFESAVAIKPDYAEAQQHLRELRAAIGRPR